MSWDLFVRLVGEVAWPLVVIVAILFFRSQLGTLLTRVETLRGPGIEMDLGHAKTQIAEIVAEGMKQQETPEQVAQRIVRETVVDPAQQRILRALFGERNGRALANYRNDPYYRPAFGALLQKGWIREASGAYVLTDDGMKVTSDYLSNLLQAQVPRPATVVDGSR